MEPQASPLEELTSQWKDKSSYLAVTLIATWVVSSTWMVFLCSDSSSFLKNIYVDGISCSVGVEDFYQWVFPDPFDFVSGSLSKRGTLLKYWTWLWGNSAKLSQDVASLKFIGLSNISPKKKYSVLLEMVVIFKQPF